MSEQDRKSYRQLLAAVAILAVGGVLAGALVLTRAIPPRQDRPVVHPLVEAIQAQRQDLKVMIQGHGTVQSTVRTQLVPEVGGRVVSVHENLFNGGFVPAGKPLVMIEPSDYRLTLEEARSQLDQARATLATMQTNVLEAQANLTDATRDLERTQQLFERGVMSRSDSDKADISWQVAQVRLEKQKAELQSAQSRLDSSQIAVRKAELNLSRTRVTLPFDAVVLNERVDVGQYIAPGQNIGEVYGTSTVEIPVPLEDHRLQWLPGLPIGGRQSPLHSSSLPRAEVKARFAGRPCFWSGRVVRTEGQVDPNSRMIAVVVRVDDPLHGLSPDQPPLLPGTFVEVSIHGATIEDIIRVPDWAVHDANELWVLEGDRLRVRKVTIAYRERDWAYISSGLDEGERIIVSSMDVVTDGMQVRVAEESRLGADN